MPSHKLIFRHCFFWILFITYELTGVKFSLGVAGPFYRPFIFYLFYIAVFYINAHLILDFAFFRTSHPYLIAIGLINLEIVFFFFLKIILDSLVFSRTLPFALSMAFHEQYIFSNVYRMSYFIGLSIAYWSTLYLFRFKDRHHRVETERLTALAQNLELENRFITVENAYLQNQVSPHLLFNSLNFIYNAVYKISEKAGNGVMLLAELLRFSLIRPEDKEVIPLALELEQIDNLIRLNRLRFGDRLFLNFRKKGKIKETQVLPLILITLVENMMKHGDLGDPGSPGYIRLEVSDGRLYFETKNKKRTGSLFPKSGLGLLNVEKRLANFYPDRYALDIKDDENEFIVILNLTL